MSAAAIYRGMTREELNRQYDQRSLVPDFAPLFARWRAESEAVARLRGPPLRLPYGPQPEQYIDVFTAPGPCRSLHLHYHGGAWKALGSRDCWWLAPPWLEAGYHFAAVNFSLVPAVSLAQQVAEAEEALRRLPALLRESGVETGERLVVSGHSSGAHLAALAALTDGTAAAPLPWRPELVVLASGLYDLEPVRLSSRNDYLALEEPVALRYSPLRRLGPAAARVVVLWSRHELDEFRRQSREFAEALQRQGGAVRAIESEAPTHFDTWDEIQPVLAAEGAQGKRKGAA